MSDINNLILVQNTQAINSIKSRLLKVEQQIGLADAPAGGRKKRRRKTKKRKSVYKRKSRRK